MQSKENITRKIEQVRQSIILLENRIKLFKENGYWEAGDYYSAILYEKQQLVDILLWILGDDNET